MTNLTFAQLCAEYGAVIETITRLSGLKPEYRPDEYPYVLEQQRARRAALLAEMQARIQQAIERRNGDGL